MAILGNEIFRIHDSIGPIVVHEDTNKRYLSFGGNDEQSCMLKHQPEQLQYEYTRSMLLPLLFIPTPQKALLLGLGGGSIASSLHYGFNNIEITAIELRSAVIETAFNYFELPKSPRLKVIHGDANNYLRELEYENMQIATAEKFDIIFSDIYGNQGLDNRQLEENYLDQCLQALKDDSWLVLNFWQQHRHDNSLLAKLRARFDDIRMCSTQSDNWIVLASQHKNNLTANELRGRAKVLSKHFGFSLLKPLAKLRLVR